MIFFRFNDFEIINQIYDNLYIWNFDILEILKIIKNHMIIIFSMVIVMFLPNIFELFKNDKIYSNIESNENNKYNYIASKYIYNFLVPSLSVFIFFNLSKQETFIYFMF